MNILILHGSSDLYGASKILLFTVQVCKKQGHTPIVVLSEKGLLADALAELGIEVIYIRLGILRRKYKSIKGVFNRLYRLRKAYHSIKELVKEKKITLIYSNTTAVLVGAFVAKKMRVQHIWHVHEIIEKPFWLYQCMGRLVNHYSDKVIVVSVSVEKSWLRFVAPEKLHLIYNGIDYSPYLKPSDKLRTELGLAPEIAVVGMIGRVHYWKGQNYFLKIAGILSQQFPQLRFVMIGDAFPGYEYIYSELAAYKKAENLETLVFDLGYRTDVAELLQGFDILVLPSQLPDPFPTVILEAMAAGKPVAATAQGGALEMVDENITGVLIPLTDPQKAASIIGKLVDDSNRRLALGTAGRKKVLSEYSFEAFENKMIKVLE
jgi:glycosyltransferase involved in cell wall biosynthesis